MDGRDLTGRHACTASEANVPSNHRSQQPVQERQQLELLRSLYELNTDIQMLVSIWM